MLGQLGHSPSPHGTATWSLQKDGHAYGAVQAPRECSKSGECRVPDAGEAEPRTGAAPFLHQFFSVAPLSSIQNQPRSEEWGMHTPLSVVKNLWPF